MNKQQRSMGECNVGACLLTAGVVGGVVSALVKSGVETL